jgi:hypothetical protein
MAVAFVAYQVQIPLIRAAAKAGVPYVLPTEYGSDATNARLNAEISLMTMKEPYRKLIEDLGVSSWIGIANNPWFEFVLSTRMVGLDIAKKEALLLDGGEIKANMTTLPRVGESVAALLALPEKDLAAYKNDWVYLSSFLVSQRDLLESAKRVTGTKESDWTISHDKAEKVLKDAQEAFGKGDLEGSRKGLLMGAVFHDDLGGNYSSKVIDYQKLGLEPEDLDEAMRRTIQHMGLL